MEEDLSDENEKFYLEDQNNYIFNELQIHLKVKLVDYCPLKLTQIDKWDKLWSGQK
jgi:hypothetical protein